MHYLRSTGFCYRPCCELLCQTRLVFTRDSVHTGLSYFLFEWKFRSKITKRLVLKIRIVNRDDSWKVPNWNGYHVLMGLYLKTWKCIYITNQFNWYTIYQPKRLIGINVRFVSRTGSVQYSPGNKKRGKESCICQCEWSQVNGDWQEPHIGTEQDKQRDSIPHEADGNDDRGNILR